MSTPNINPEISITIESTVHSSVANFAGEQFKIDNQINEAGIAIDPSPEAAALLITCMQVFQNVALGSLSEATEPLDDDTPFTMLMRVMEAGDIIRRQGEQCVLALDGATWPDHAAKVQMDDLWETKQKSIEHLNESLGDIAQYAFNAYADEVFFNLGGKETK